MKDREVLQLNLELLPRNSKGKSGNEERKKKNEETIQYYKHFLNFEKRNQLDEFDLRKTKCKKKFAKKQFLAIFSLLINASNHENCVTYYNPLSTCCY